MADSSPVIPHLLLVKSATEMRVEFNATNMRFLVFQMTEATCDAAQMFGHRRRKLFEMTFVKVSISAPHFPGSLWQWRTTSKETSLTFLSTFTKTNRPSRTGSS
jgi:hypothetical protein